MYTLMVDHAFKINCIEFYRFIYTLSIIYTLVPCPYIKCNCDMYMYNYIYNEQT